MNTFDIGEMRNIYNQFGINSLYIDYVCKQVHEIAPFDLQKRYLKIQEHVQTTFNCEEFVYTFTDKQSSRVTRPEYYMQASRNVNTDMKMVLIYSKGTNNDIFHLISTLHEIGHGIDFMKRGMYEFNEDVADNVIYKETWAWIYGLRLGLLTGLVSRKEVESTFMRSMACLATYCKYYCMHENDFIRLIQKIEKEIYK